MSEQKVLQCYFCGNETLMNLVGEHRNDWSEDEYHSYYGYFIDQMYSCPVCDRVTLFQKSWDCAVPDEAEFIEEKILYPVNALGNSSAPKEIKTAYESALKTRHINNALCLIALRRTLEMICKDKNAKGSSLYEKLQHLSEKGILPPELHNAATVTKEYGNIGAHEDDVVSDAELSQISDFVRYLIEYLYILPQKLQEIQRKMDYRNAKKTKGANNQC